LVEHGQGFRDMRHAVDTLEKLAVDSKLRHGGHPILSWCISNARTTSDAAGNRKLDKARSHGRIDGAVALAMALGLATRADTAEPWEPLLEVI
jgi:phage terminase large subunit-like protein